MAISPTAVTTGPNDVATSSSDVATPDGGHQDVPSLPDFLYKICDGLKKPPKVLESVVSTFQAEDVDTIELLVTLFGVQTQYTALKTAVQGGNIKAVGVNKHTR